MIFMSVKSKLTENISQNLHAFKKDFLMNLESS